MINFSATNLSYMVTELDVVFVALTSATTVFDIIDRVSLTELFECLESNTCW